MWGLGYYSEKKRYQRAKKRYVKELAQERRYQARLREARLRARVRQEKKELFGLEHPHIVGIGHALKRGGHSIGSQAIGYGKKTVLGRSPKPYRRRRRTRRYARGWV